VLIDSKPSWVFRARAGDPPWAFANSVEIISTKGLGDRRDRGTMQTNHGLEGTIPLSMEEFGMEQET
jgi:hypothetical protein